MPFDSLVTAAVVAELAEKVAEGFVGKVFQPTSLEVVLHCRAHGENQRILLSAEAQSYRLGLVGSSPPNPETPPQFCRVLRKHLEGSRLLSVEQMGMERVVTLRFSRSDGERRLHAELMGKHSNLVLVDAQGVILDAIKPISRRVNRYREVLPGRPYVPPPSPEKADPRTLDQEALAALLAEAGETVTRATLVRRLAGLGSFAAEEVLAAADGESPAVVAAALRRLLDRLSEGDYRPTVLLDAGGEPADYWAFQSRRTPPEQQAPRGSMSAALEEVTRAHGERRETALQRDQALARLRSALRKARKRLEALEASRRKAEDSEGCRIAGELLLAHQGQVPRGAEAVDLPNFYDPSQAALTIALDPTLSPVENAERYFQRYRKARSGLPTLEEQILELMERLEGLEALERRMAGAPSEALPNLLREADRLAPAPPPQPVPLRVPQEAGPQPRVRRLTSSDGWEILLGETQEGNDYLTTRMAAPDDLWLHVRGAASAHVVIRTAKRPEAVPYSTLLEAARAAAAHSEAKHSAVVAVDYTLRKHVRKPRGSGPGKVLYEKEKTLHVDPTSSG